MRYLQSLIQKAEDTPVLPTYRKEDHFEAEEEVYCCYSYKIDNTDCALAHGTLKAGGPFPSAQYKPLHVINLDAEYPVPEHQEREGMTSQTSEFVTSPLLMKVSTRNYLKAHPEFHPYYLIAADRDERRIFGNTTL